MALLIRSGTGSDASGFHRGFRVSVAPLFQPGAPRASAEGALRRLTRSGGPAELQFLCPLHAKPDDFDALTALQQRLRKSWTHRADALHDVARLFSVRTRIFVCRSGVARFVIKVPLKKVGTVKRPSSSSLS